MSKRFIDTGLFDDDWFMDLSKDAKLLWIYFITKCNHAGMIKLNPKLCKVQTDIKELETVIKQLSNRLVTVSEHLYFIPKFIDFQYPGFPNSKVRSQISAIAILKKHGLIDEENLTLIKGLDNSYEHEHDNEHEHVIKELYKGIEIFFDEDCRPKTEKQIQDWYDTLDKLIRIDGYTPEHIHDVIKRARMDDFWRQNFLSVLKLRKKNKEGIPYFTVFEKKLYNEVNKRDSGATIEQLAEVAYRSQFEESNQ